MLIEFVLDAFGVKGTFSDRHARSITALFVGLLAALSVAVVVTIAMVLSGHT